MKSSMARLSVFAALIAASTQAMAADWGGIRDYSANAGRPVPAPVPIPEYKPSWYFRFDAGLGIVNDPELSDSEFTFGDGFPGPITGPLELTSQSSWFNGDFDTFLTLGAGVGYYFSSGWRMDATVEKRSKDDANIFGQYEDDTFAFDGGGNYVIVDSGGVAGVADTRTRLTVDEDTKLDGTLWLANFYYDFGHVGRFTPYIGAGLGFAWNEISRSRSQTLETCDNEAVGPAGCDSGAVQGTYTPVGATETASDKADKVTLAAAAMVGFSYEVSDMTSVDLGYRYLFVQGTDAVLTIGGEQSRLEIGDQHVHQLRAGLRFNVE
jgi:opacity protein-like surface antigen